MIDPNDLAVPVYDTTKPKGRQGGLTIRQELAARAMQALLSNPAVVNMGSPSLNEQSVADIAVAHADALIVRLNVEPI